MALPKSSCLKFGRRIRGMKPRNGTTDTVEKKLQNCGMINQYLYIVTCIILYESKTCKFRMKSEISKFKRPLCVESSLHCRLPVEKEQCLGENRIEVQNKSDSVQQQEGKKFEENCQVGVPRPFKKEKINLPKASKSPSWR